MAKKSKILCTTGASLIAAVLIAGNVVASIFSNTITNAVCGFGSQDFNSGAFQEVAANSDALCRKVAEEGIALIKNEDCQDGKPCLPLTYTAGQEKRINVFGWAATDSGFLLRGIGSGSSTIDKNKTVSLLQGLTDAGFKYNQNLINFYENFKKKDFSYATGSQDRVPLIEPAIDDYDQDLLDEAFNYSDTAVVVISRVGGENIGELTPNAQKKDSLPTDNNRSYLHISTEEEALLEYVRENYDRTIVIINSANQMELGFLDDIGIDACLNVGLLGQSGAAAIGKILCGEVNPSGHLTDTYAYEYNDLETSPSFVNYVRQGNHIQYAEDIYYGYKWYETAAVEGFFDGISNDYGTGYDAVVQYPFGYGLSYTEFEWTLTDINKPDNTSFKEENKNDTIELTFSCTNVGSVPGKDVMQIYYTAPYEKGGVEKSAINLIDFAKTNEIPAGQTQTGIKISFSLSDMASYDCYDKNENGFATYELDGSSTPYLLKFMEDSHHEKNVIQNNKPVNTIKYYIDDDIIYDKDPVTGATVENRFTGDNAYGNTPIDGSSVSSQMSYLSRANFKGTYPKKLATNTIDSNGVNVANKYQNKSFDQTSMPTLGASNNLYLYTNEDGSKASLQSLNGNGKTIANEELITEIGHDYDSEKLDMLVDQLSAEDACSLVENGGFGSNAIESIGKRRVLDFDGPAGFNNNVSRPSSDTGGWTAFPCETLIGQTFDKFIAKQIGLEMGLEGKATGISGWYGPGINLHRSPFNARNYEYYSEDPVLSGYLAANTILGAKANGVYAYVKHFTLSEPGQNAKSLNTWLTEQNLRENYLKPFEIAVKKGESNAMMTAFNSIGGTWAGACKAQNIDILRNEWGFKGSLITDYDTNDGSMGIVNGVRAGNDLWLNPDGSNKLSRSSATDVYCAKMAVKNIIYTYCNTYTFAKEYDHSNDTINVEIGDVMVKQPFAWWIPVLIGVDILAAGSIGVWMYFVWLRKPKA